MEYNSGKQLPGLSTNFPVRIWVLVWLILIPIFFLADRCTPQKIVAPESSRIRTELHLDSATGEWIEVPVIEE